MNDPGDVCGSGLTLCAHITRIRRRLIKLHWFSLVVAVKTTISLLAPRWTPISLGRVFPHINYCLPQPQS